VTEEPIAPEPVVAEVSLPVERQQAKPVAKLEVKNVVERAQAKVLDKPEVKPEVKPVSKPAAKPEAARALAILEDKPVAAQQYVVQVAALQSQEKVNELQGKLKAAGISSFTQKSGEWIRIRVGPVSKEEGAQVRAKLTRLGLSGSMVPN
jgi:DedD protein